MSDLQGFEYPDEIDGVYTVDNLGLECLCEHLRDKFVGKDIVVLVKQEEENQFLSLIK
jgi:hypothetical protein